MSTNYLKSRQAQGETPLNFVYPVVMNRPHPHVMFYGDALHADMEIAFLRESVDSLERLLGEAAARSNSDHPPLDDAVIALAGDHETLYGTILPELIHETHAISCIVLLERICRDFVKELAIALPSELSLNDLSGSILQRFRNYCEKVASIEIGLSANEWQTLQGLVALRNTLIHTSGNIENSRDKQRIELFVNQHQTPEIVDGRLRFSRNTSELYLDTLSRFVEAVFEAALTRFPKDEM